jgi:HAD superfamily hydrolase (TIGR01509 family)
MTVPEHLRDCTHWIFDMDGTLTVAVHDFDAIRSALGLPPGEPILESLDALPPAQAEPLYTKLDELELYYAQQARAQTGAAQLLETLVARGDQIGILTRNGEKLAEITLAVCGLADYFEPNQVLGRESAQPKPSPDGIRHLLSNWETTPASAVMVGDFLFDIQAGEKAGCTTVYYDPQQTREWSEQADLTVHSHAELIALAIRT